MGRRSAIAACLILATALAPGVSAAEAWIQPADLRYLGAFRLPEAVDQERTFAYGGTALASDSRNDSLFVVGHDWYQLTAEVNTPRPIVADSPDALLRARYRQGFADASGGLIDETGGDGNKVGGQLLHRGRLYGSAYVYYDAAGEQVRSHWRRPTTDLDAGTARGLFRLGDVGAGFVSGYMAAVPRVWQDRIGGPALTGNCCIPIIGRTSFGPAAFAFDPATLGAGINPVSPLVYYPQEHPEIGEWDADWDPANGVLFNGTTSIRGLVFPPADRSVLFFGTQGTGEFCYGAGTDDPALHGQPTPDGTIWCYDPEESSKGTHGYPYAPRVWAFDAEDLADVRAGSMDPWQVRPYATWELDLPFGSNRVGGAAYDADRGLIYLSQQFGDGEQSAIHVFKFRKAP